MKDLTKHTARFLDCFILLIYFNYFRRVLYKYLPTTLKLFKERHNMKLKPDLYNETHLSCFCMKNTNSLHLWLFIL